jgi:hypothetical protein
MFLLSMRPRSTACALALVVCSGGGCLGGSEDEIDRSALARDYDGYVRALEERREPFGQAEIEAPVAAGSAIYWREREATTVSFHRLDTVSKERIDYAFSIGTLELSSVRVSSEVVATFAKRLDGVAYLAYSARSPNQVLGETLLPTPSNGESYWAYAVDAGNVYILIQADKTEILRWKPGSTPEPVAGLEELGIQLAQTTVRSDRLGVVGSHAVVRDGEDLLIVDMEERTVERHASLWFALGAYGLAYFSNAAGHWQYLDFSDGKTIDLTAQIDSIPCSALADNPAYSHVHQGPMVGALWGTNFAYTNGWGLFLHDLAAKTVRPVLLLPEQPQERAYACPTLAEKMVLVRESSSPLDCGGALFSVDM